MKKLTKKLFIIAMIAAGAVLSKPAFAMEASNSSGTNQYSNVDLTKYETYNSYIVSIKKIIEDFADDILMKTALFKYPAEHSKHSTDILQKWNNLNAKVTSFKEMFGSYIDNLTKALNKAYASKNMNNPNYAEYAKQFFDRYNSFTEQYNSISQQKKQLESDIIDLLQKENIPGYKFVKFPDNENSSETRPNTEK